MERSDRNRTHRALPVLGLGVVFLLGAAHPVAALSHAPLQQDSHHSAAANKTQPRQHVHKIVKAVLPVAEIRRTLLTSLASSEGTSKGTVFPTPPQIATCPARDHCSAVYYTQAYRGPQDQIGGVALMSSPLLHPNVVTVITLAAGGIDSIQGYESFGVPEPAAKSLLKHQQ